MTITIEAIYEDGVLKPAEPLPLKEHEQVRITVDARVSNLADCYGMMGWKGTHEELEQLLAEAEEYEELP
jgi:predicted DNA-binding antitoxin AbrB/MazE fold protein